MEKVEAFYDRSAEYEWHRLERHRTELAITLRALDEHLPLPPARVLDVGGGPGRYTIELARRGYTVSELDLSASCLEFAQRKASELRVEVAEFVHGNALDLGRFSEASFDAVLLMGPLYHLFSEADRVQAVREASRVLRLGGIVVAAFIARYAAVRDAAKNGPESILDRLPAWEQALRTGFLDNSDDGGFTDAYLATPAEVAPLMAQGGFESLDLLSAEGVVAYFEEGVEKLNGDAWEAWVDLNYRLGKDPSGLAAACHLLYVGRKS